MSLSWLGFYFLTAWASVMADKDTEFFKLHQATGFFEQYVAGHCPNGKEKASNLLKSFGNGDIDSELKSKLHELEAKIGSKQVPDISDIESFRLSIHELQQRRGFHHEGRWHIDIVSECRAGKTTRSADTGSLGNRKVTIPKFQCTAIEILDAATVRRFLGSGQYPSVSLRKSIPDKWIFSRNGTQIELGRESVSEVFDPVAQKTSYRIQEQQSLLDFELVGTPPSRQGFLWEIKRLPEPSTKIAKITCH